MSDEIIITYEMGGGLIKRKKLKREKKIINYIYLLF